MSDIKHLVILGAGASYDFAHPVSRGGSEDPIFPLTNHLVDGRYINTKLANKYNPVRTLFARIPSCVRRASFEKCLEAYDDQEQLLALRFYLGELFWELSNSELVKSIPANNYLALIDRMKKSSSRGAYVVTFNYDVLLENEIGINRFKKMGDYINGNVDNIRLIKIHGSCDWVRINRKPSSAYPTNSRQRIIQMGAPPDSYEHAVNNPEFVNGDSQIYTKRDLGTEANDFYKLPQLAIPITATKSHVCPPEHIASLVMGLTQIQKILVIGWKAGDPYLLELMKKNIKLPTSLTVVSGTEEGAQEIAGTLQSQIPLITSVKTYAGFSDFIGGSDECEDFFQ